MEKGTIGESGLTFVLHVESVKISHVRETDAVRVKVATFFEARKKRVKRQRAQQKCSKRKLTLGT